MSLAGLNSRRDMFEKTLKVAKPKGFKTLVGLVCSCLRFRKRKTIKTPKESVSGNVG